MEHLTELAAEHACRQSEALARCRQIAAASTDPTFEFIMQPILDDLQRDAVLLRRIVATMRGAVTWTRSKDGLPVCSILDHPVNSILVGSIRGEIRYQQLSARELRKLAARFKRINAGLDTLLFQMMAADSPAADHMDPGAPADTGAA